MKAQKDHEIHFRIIVENLPAGDHPEHGKLAARLYSKKGWEHAPEIFEDQWRFTGKIRVRENPKDGSPNFLGEFARGPVEERHLAVFWGNVEKDGTFIKRYGVKIFLAPVTRAKWNRPGITWEQIKAGGVIETCFSACDEDGVPRCAGIPTDWIQKKK